MTELTWTNERIVDAILDPNPSVRLDGLKAMSDMLTAAIAAKDERIATLEWALATLSAERKTEVAELEAIKASLAAKAAQTDRRTKNADMLQDAGDGEYTV